jgi:hypothetical protein
VQSPNAFLPKELRNYQRLDGRKQQLKTDISRCLATSKNYDEFEQKMKELKYDLIRMRGIAFRDPQKVYTKGSEVGYSLATIEKVLAQTQALQIEQKKEIIQQAPRYMKSLKDSSQASGEKQFEENSQSSLNILFKPNSEFEEAFNLSLTEEEQKRRRKHKHRH